MNIFLISMATIALKEESLVNFKTLLMKIKSISFYPLAFS